VNGPRSQMGDSTLTGGTRLPVPLAPSVRCIAASRLLRRSEDRLLHEKRSAFLRMRRDGAVHLGFASERRDGNLFTLWDSRIGQRSYHWEWTATSDSYRYHDLEVSWHFACLCRMQRACSHLGRSFPLDTPPVNRRETRIATSISEATPADCWNPPS
jgi:hypothetical protein